MIGTLELGTAPGDAAGLAIDSRVPVSVIIEVKPEGDTYRVAFTGAVWTRNRRGFYAGGRSLT